MNLHLHSGYFSLKNPLDMIDRWLNPFHHKENIDIRGKKMAIHYSKRAETALQNRNISLIAELQLYFTCVVQKRVIFHEQTDIETIRVNEKLEIAYHTVQSEACDPTVFANKHPVKRKLTSHGAAAMRPSLFTLDFRKGEWIGDFSF